jgi:hypothetical protein
VYRIILTLLCITTSAYAYIDSDFDGVEDTYDLCPQTPLSDLVDNDGCVLKSVSSKPLIDLVTSVGYSQINYATQEASDTFSASLQADIYLGKWWIQGIISHYQSDNGVDSESGLEDTAMNLMYQFTPTDKITLTTGLGVLLPTYQSLYNNEAIDYTTSIDLVYPLNETFSLFGGTNYTWVNDRNVAEEQYQNTFGLYTGIEYIYPNGKAVFTAAYYQHESIYLSTPTIKYINFGCAYTINPHWSIGGTYGFGLSDSASDQSISGYIGYLF